MLLQQGSMISVVWEKQDGTTSDEFKCEIKAKKQGIHISFYFLCIKITLVLFNTLGGKIGVMDVSFHIVSKGHCDLLKKEKC